MAKDIVQATNNKGVAGWSLKTDDNATVDPTINWQEGQAPSTVNNSARAMMTRIREQYDMDQEQLKKTANSFGVNVVLKKAEKVTITQPDAAKRAFEITIQVPLERAQELLDYYNSKIYFLIDMTVKDIEKDPLYQTFGYDCIFSLKIEYIYSSASEVSNVRFRLNMFGQEIQNEVCSYYELQHILGNVVLFNSKGSTPVAMNTIPIIMKKSFVGRSFGMIPRPPNSGYKYTQIWNKDWYYISPNLCVINYYIERDVSGSVNIINNFGPQDVIISVYWSGSYKGITAFIPNNDNKLSTLQLVGGSGDDIEAVVTFRQHFTNPDKAGYPLITSPKPLPQISFPESNKFERLTPRPDIYPFFT